MNLELRVLSWNWRVSYGAIWWFFFTLQSLVWATVKGMMTLPRILKDAAKVFFEFLGYWKLHTRRCDRFTAHCWKRVPFAFFFHGPAAESRELEAGGRLGLWMYMCVKAAALYHLMRPFAAGSEADSGWFSQRADFQLTITEFHYFYWVSEESTDIWRDESTARALQRLANHCFCSLYCAYFAKCHWQRHLAGWAGFF